MEIWAEVQHMLREPAPLEWLADESWEIGDEANTMDEAVRNGNLLAAKEAAVTVAKLAKRFAETLSHEIQLRNRADQTAREALESPPKQKKE